MTNTKNNVPIYIEEQIVSEEREVLNTPKIISQNFVELTIYGKNSSTEELGLPKDPCWRYNFAYNGGKKWLILDIPQNLMGKLGLEPSKNYSGLIFISPEVLKREPECGGITLQSEKEILLVSQGSKLVREKEIQTKLTSEEIRELEEKLEELEIKSVDLEKLKNIWRNKFLEEKESNGQEFRDQITGLIQERNNIQRELNNQQIRVGNLRNEIDRLNNNLADTHRERDRLKHSLKRNFINFLLKNKKKKKRIKELNNSLSFLRGLLTDKKQATTNLANERDNLQNQVNQLTIQINNLTTERNNRPNVTHQVYNNLVQERNEIRNQLTVANTLITNTQNRLGINNLNNLPPFPYGETLISLLGRPTQQQLQTEQNRANGLNQQLIIANNTITNKDNIIIGLRSKIDEIEIERNNRPNISLYQWNSDYSRRPTQQELNNLQIQLSNVQQELDKEKDWWDKAMKDGGGIVNEKISICSCADYCSCFYFNSGGAPHYFFGSDEKFNGTYVVGKFRYCAEGLKWLKEARKKYL